MYSCVYTFSKYNYYELLINIPFSEQELGSSEAKVKMDEGAPSLFILTSTGEGRVTSSSIYVN
jgi:hypothetical protein